MVTDGGVARGRTEALRRAEAGSRIGPSESHAILASFLDRGGNFIDTANLYNCGHSEKIIGEYFAQNVAKRQRTVIATKFFSDLHFNGSRWAKSGCSASITCGVGTAATSDRFRSREFGAF
jgi:aryl-alcohol dehydrogenase-like predicted oxidoreductase